MPDAPITRTLFRDDPARPGQQIATEPYCGHLSGRVTPLLSPRPEDHVIDDIALGLARIRRYVGQTSRHYSVAEHCVRVADHLGEIGQPARVQLAGLLHDAVEYLTGDIPPPVRDAWRLMDGHGFAETFRVFEQRHRRAIHRMAGLPADLPDDWAEIIRITDGRLRATEVRDLRPEALPGWTGGQPETIEPLPGMIHPWTSADAEAFFLARFRLLCERRDREITFGGDHE